MCWCLVCECVVCVSVFVCVRAGGSVGAYVLCVCLVCVECVLCLLRVLFMWYENIYEYVFGFLCVWMGWGVCL